MFNEEEVLRSIISSLQIIMSFTIREFLENIDISILECKHSTVYYRHYINKNVNVIPTIHYSIYIYIPGFEVHRRITMDLSK